MIVLDNLIKFYFSISQRFITHSPISNIQFHKKYTFFTFHCFKHFLIENIINRDSYILLFIDYCAI